MALTQLKTGAIADDAVTTDKLANAINTERTANTAKVSTTIMNNANNRVITGSNTANTLNGESNVVISSSGALIVADTSAYSDGTFGEAKLQFNAKTGNHIGACSVADTTNSITHVLFKNPNGAIASVGTHNSDFVAFTGNTERLRILSSGGITFNGDTAAANALNDYEEGTFTPTLIYQNSSGLTLGTNSASGKYTKIGRIIYILGYINWSVSGSPVNDNIGFGGLPFSTATGAISAGDTRFVGNITLKNTNAQSVDHQIVEYGNNAVVIIAENNQGNLANELGSGSNFQARFQFWYHAT